MSKIDTEFIIDIKALVRILIGAFVISIGISFATYQWYWLALPLVLIVGLLPFYNLRYYYWLFFAIFPLSAQVELPGGLSLTLPDEPMMVGFLVIVTLLLIQNIKNFPDWLWKNSITIIILLQLVWTIVSVIMADEYIFSIKFLLAKLWFLSTFFFIPIFIYKDKKDIKRTFLLLIVPVVIHAVFAFLWHAKLKFGYQESNYVVTPFYKNHVDYGAILSVVYLMIIAAIPLLNKLQNKNYKIVSIVVLIFLTIAIYVAFSRAAILATLFGIIVLLAIKKKLVNYLLPTFYIFIIVSLSALAYNNTYLKFRPNMAKNATQETFLDTVVGAFTGKDMSSMERFYRWIATIRMVKDNPMTGVGPNNWYYHYKPNAVNSFKTWVSRNPERSTTHNYFLLMVAEQGIPAMLLYAILLVVALKKCQIVYYRFKDPFWKQVTLGIAMVIGATFVNNFFSEFIETHKVGGIYFLSLSLLVIMDFKSKQELKKIV